MSDALLQLEPLTTPLDRYLLIETRSGWSAVFSNGLRVNDVSSPVSYLRIVLKCRGLEVIYVPDRSGTTVKDALRVYGLLYLPCTVLTRLIGSIEFATLQ